MEDVLKSVGVAGVGEWGRDHESETLHLRPHAAAPSEDLEFVPGGGRENPGPESLEDVGEVGGRVIDLHAPAVLIYDFELVRVELVIVQAARGCVQPRVLCLL